jgi:hypothetical protein
LTEQSNTQVAEQIKQVIEELPSSSPRVIVCLPLNHTL